MTKRVSGTERRARLWRLCRKELRETLRDRRTILTLVLMPLLLYPLLGMTLQRFLLSSAMNVDPTFLVGVSNERDGLWLRSIVEDTRSLPPREVREASDSELALFDVVSDANLSPDELLERGQIDVAARVVQWNPPTIEFTAMKGNSVSQSARRILVERLQWYKMASSEEAVAAVTSEAYQAPIAVRVRTIGVDTSQSMLATVIPLVLILMTITGAVYPAIDLTAGERERGTIEALIASPISRWQLLLAKYVAVVTVALLTALVNLAAMFVTLWASGLLERLTDGKGFPALEMLQVLGLLVLFSAFFSALLLSLTSFAKSFKEAQAYLIPLMLLALTPGIFSLMPGVELKGPLAIVPLVNIVLLARDLLAGGFAPAPAIAAVVSTFAYAAAALAVAARLFGSDAVLRGSELSIQSLFHRPAATREVPSISEVTLTFAIIFPAYYIVSNVLARQTFGVEALIFVVNAASLALVFGGLPLLAAWLGRDRLVPTFRLETTHPIGKTSWMILGAGVMGLGLWPLAHEVFVLADQLGFGGLQPEKLQGAESTLEILQRTPVWLVLATLALAPAVIEELCFRGYLFSSLSRVISPARVIVLTALIFGLFHVLTGSILLIERFLPTAMMGLFLGWVAWRSGSVYPGMLLHFVHNGLLNLAAIYKDELEFLGIADEAQPHLPLSWIVIGTTLVIIGMSMVQFGSRAQQTSVSELPAPLTN